MIERTWNVLVNVSLSSWVVCALVLVMKATPQMFDGSFVGFLQWVGHAAVGAVLLMRIWRV